MSKSGLFFLYDLATYKEYGGGGMVLVGQPPLKTLESLSAGKAHIKWNCPTGRYLLVNVDTDEQTIVEKEKPQ